MSNLIRKSIHSLEEIELLLREKVLDNIDCPKRLPKNKKSSLIVEINGEVIYALSDRYKLFFSKGYKCIDCGLEGKYFALEKDRKANGYHLNLYSIKDGEEILMTKDHIIPKSKGGTDELNNYQTMCRICNIKKGSIL